MLGSLLRDPRCGFLSMQDPHRNMSASVFVPLYARSRACGVLACARLSVSAHRLVWVKVEGRGEPAIQPGLEFARRFAEEEYEPHHHLCAGVDARRCHCRAFDARDRRDRPHCFVCVCALFVYTVFTFRKRSDDDGSEPAQVYGSNQVELAWTVIPWSHSVSHLSCWVKRGLLTWRRPWCLAPGSFTGRIDWPSSEPTRRHDGCCSRRSSTFP
jgi:hypothetical protein